MARTVRVLATLSIPSLALVAAAAPQLVANVFGSEWHAAVPIIQVMTLTGVVQTVYKCSTASLLLGFGMAVSALRYALLITIVTAIGIVAGLPFGIFGVAVGLSTATGILVPIEWFIRKRILGMSIRTQIAALLPAIHCAVWAAGAYIGAVRVIPGEGIGLLAVGTGLGLAAWVTVMRLCHRALYDELRQIGRHLRGRATEDAS